MTIDFRELLKKYIAHVGESEGVCFIRDQERQPYQAGPYTISSEEHDTLRKLSQEVDDEYRKKL